MIVECSEIECWNVGSIWVPVSVRGFCVTYILGGLLSGF